MSLHVHHELRMSTSLKRDSCTVRRLRLGLWVALPLTKPQP